MDLYEKIQYYRKKNNIGQSDLADRLDVSRQTVYKWEQGISSPDIDKLPVLAALFGITVDELLSKDMPKDDILVKEEPDEAPSVARTRRSMTDYLLMIPFGLGIGIFIFMFYCFGAMFIGFFYAAFAISCVAPFGALFMLFTVKHLGILFILLATIFAGLGLVMPLWYFSRWYMKKYISLSKKLFKKIKSFDVRRVI